MKIANTSLQEYMGDVKATNAKLGLYSSRSEARDFAWKSCVLSYYHKEFEKISIKLGLPQEDMNILSQNCRNGNMLYPM